MSAIEMETIFSNLTSIMREWVKECDEERFESIYP
jgi:hypothetical protein